MCALSKKDEEFKLVQEILAGSKQKYRLLVERYSPMVFHIVRRFENNEQDVKELAQQIFVKAYERLDSFASQSRFSSWIYSLAMNHCRDYAKNIRRTNKRLSDMEEEEQEATMYTEETPLNRLVDKEWRQRVVWALQQVSKEYADPLLMKYRDGLTYQAMSKRLGVSVAALKVRVHRARKELKEIIENEEQP